MYVTSHMLALLLLPTPSPTILAKMIKLCSCSTILLLIIWCSISGWFQITRAETNVLVWRTRYHVFTIWDPNFVVTLKIWLCVNSVNVLLLILPDLHFVLHAAMQWTLWPACTTMWRSRLTPSCRGPTCHWNTWSICCNSERWRDTSCRCIIIDHHQICSDQQLASKIYSIRLGDDSNGTVGP